MSFNLKKLAVATAVLVSTVGLFGESAEARRGIHSGDSEFKQDGQQLQGSFDIVTDKPFDDAVESFSLTDPSTGETLFTSAIGSIKPELLETENDVNDFLKSQELDKFGITRDDVFDRIPNGEEPIASYVVDLSNDLNPNEEGQLILFYDNEFASEENGWEQNLVDSLEQVLRYAGEETVPGVLIRDSRDGLDDNIPNVPNDVNVRNGRTVDRFGVGEEFPASVPFSVTIPEPTTGNSLLIAGAFGGLLILKRNQRVKKLRANIKN